MGWSELVCTHYMYYVYVLIFCGHVMAVCDFIGEPYGELWPHDPNAAVGQPLELQCTLGEDIMNSNKCDSSDIAFEIRNGSNQKFAVEGMVINKTTAALYLAEVNLPHGIWDVYCLIKLTKRKKMDVTYEIMYVGYVPYKPNITDVYIFNWETLVLEWSVPGNPFLKTNNAGWYQLRLGNESQKVSGKRRWKRCESEKLLEMTTEVLPLNCSVESFNTNAQAIWLKVNATNTVGKTISDVFTSDLPPLVIPGPVKNLRNSSTDKRRVTIRWDKPKPENFSISRKALVYELTYVSPRNGFHKTLDTQPSKNVSVQTDLVGLLPYTRYVVSVRCRSAKGQRFSENSTMSFYTNEDYPGAPPVVLQGNFVVKVKPGNVRDVVLYWQNVPIEERNGNLTFKITKVTQAGKSENIFLDAENLNGNLSTTMKNLSLTETYSFLIDAKTSVGFSQAKSYKHIVVLPQSQIPPGIKASFLKLNNSCVKVLWPHTDQASSLTLYWCKGKLHNENCQAELQWKKVFDVSRGGDFLTDLDFSAVQKFGTSVEVNSHHSGIHWTLCVYHVKDLPPGPQIEILRTSPHKLDFKLRNTDCATSSIVVDYCTVDANEECSGELLKKTFSVSGAGEYSLDGLQSDQMYLLHVRTMSQDVQSFRTDRSVKTPHKVVTKKLVIGVVVGAIFGFLLSCIGVYAIYKKQHTLCKKWKAPISIEYPSDQSTHPAGESCEHAVEEGKNPDTKLDTSSDAVTLDHHHQQHHHLDLRILDTLVYQNLFFPDNTSSPDAALGITIENSDWSGRPVNLHQHQQPRVVNRTSDKGENEAGRPLIISPPKINGIIDDHQHSSSSTTTPLISSGSSDYVGTGIPERHFNTVENGGNQDNIAIMTMDNMEPIGRFEGEEAENHCHVPLKTSKKRKKREQDNDLVRGHRGNKKETSSLISIPPPPLPPTKASNDNVSVGGEYARSAASGRTFSSGDSSDSRGIGSYTRADLQLQVSGICPALKGKEGDEEGEEEGEENSTLLKLEDDLEDNNSITYVTTAVRQNDAFNTPTEKTLGEQTQDV